LCFVAATDITMQQARKKYIKNEKKRQCALEAWKKSEHRLFTR
jgi:hypothetical protein